MSDRHFHHSIDIAESGTRIVCNPFVYHGTDASFAEDLLVEIPDPPAAAPSGIPR